MTVNLFDVQWYLRHNPDVAAAVSEGAFSPAQHFDLFGRFEGRSPGPTFDPSFYLAQNPDVEDAVMAGLLTESDHFQQFGITEERSFLAHFDARFYHDRNPDVEQAVKQGLVGLIQHFLEFGITEQRPIHPCFDLHAYLQANPDVALVVEQGLITPMDHLMQFGLREGRELGNGVSLAQFMNDPVYLAAIGEHRDIFQALARVAAVLPFFRAFEAPEGWTPAADTWIPIDFVPLPGVKLFVPPTVVIPDGLILPDTFERDPRPEPPAPEPIPPAPPIPDYDDGGGDPPGTRRLRDGDDVEAQSTDTRFILELDIGKGNVVKLGNYQGEQIIDLSEIHGLHVFDDDKIQQLGVRRAEYVDGIWIDPAEGEDPDIISAGLWLHGHPQLQLTDRYGDTIRFDVGSSANSFGYGTVLVNAASVSYGDVNPDAGVLLGGPGELAIGGSGIHLLILYGGSMGLGGSEDDDLELALDMFLLPEESPDSPVIIGDYDFQKLDVILPVFVTAEESMRTPLEIMVEKSGNHLDPAKGLVMVPDGGLQTDLAVSFRGQQFLHIANINDPAGAAAQSVAFLVGGDSFLIYNVHDGGVIDTRPPYDFDDLWENLGDVDPFCGCGDSVEYLVGGDGKQTIFGGDVGLAVLVGGGGDDFLSSDALTAFYVGGPGNDTIQIGAGESLVFFEASAQANGLDHIHDFKAGGEEEGGDLLIFSDFQIGLSYMDFFPRETGGEDIDDEWVNLDDVAPILLGAFGDEESMITAINDGDVERAIVVDLVRDGVAAIWFYEGREPEQVADLLYSGVLSTENFVLGAHM